MSSDGMDMAPVTLATRLRRWIIVVGYALGGYGLLEVWTFAMVLQRDSSAFDSLTVESTLYLVKLLVPTMLVVGCAGFQFRQRWARPLLVIYALCWLFVSAALVLLRLVPLTWTLSFRQAALAGWFVGPVLQNSVYAVLLLCYLRWPEVREEMKGESAGFEVPTSPT